jgi:hypothetical protein
MNQGPTRLRHYAPPELDLAALLERAARGDAESFAQFYDAQPPPLRSCLRVVANRALAEDITQEAYLGLWQSAGRFNRHRGTALSFLITIVQASGRQGQGNPGGGTERRALPPATAESRS